MSPDKNGAGRSSGLLLELVLLCSILVLCGCNLSVQSPVATKSQTSSTTPPSTVTLSRPSSKTSPLPEISSFATNPGRQFILDSKGLAMVSRTYPFFGSGSSCPHTGAHTHFRATGSQYTVNVYAPADGIISMVTYCLNIGATDRYGFSLAFARSGIDTLDFDFSIEPQDGHPCAMNPDIYKPYIFVTEGEEVKVGQVLGQMLKTTLPSDGAHIHFDIRNERTGSFSCPNLFERSIVDSFASLFDPHACGGISIPKTFCYKPGPGEDLIGLYSIP